MFSSLDLLLLLTISPPLSATKCYGAASMSTDAPHLKEKYGELIENHRDTEFTNCKEYCMMKDVSEDYRKGNYSNYNAVNYGYAGCGDEDCKDWPSKSKERCIRSVENSTTVIRLVELCCCKGDHCFKREDFGRITNHEPIVELVYDDETTVNPTESSSSKFFHLNVVDLMVLFIMAVE